MLSVFRFFGFLLVLLCALPVFAQGIQYTEPTSDWVFEKNKKEGMETVDHCLIKNLYDNGVTFILAKNTIGDYRLALHFPHTNLVKDKAYDVDLLIDDEKIGTAPALVVTPSILAIALPSDPAIIDKIGRGNTLTIAGPKDMVQFVLKGTSKAIKKLNSCPTITQPKQEMVDRLPLWLENVLINIGMTNIKLIQIENNQKLPLDYAWVSPDLFGGVKVMPYNKQKNLPDVMIGSYLNIMEALCTGTFLAEPGATKKTEKTEFKPYDIVCSTDQGDTITSLLFGVEDALITVFFFEGDENGKALEKRNALFNIFSK